MLLSYGRAAEKSLGPGLARLESASRLPAPRAKNVRGASHWRRAARQLVAGARRHARRLGRRSPPLLTNVEREHARLIAAPARRDLGRDHALGVHAARRRRPIAVDQIVPRHRATRRRRRRQRRSRRPRVDGRLRRRVDGERRRRDLRTGWRRRCHRAAPHGTRALESLAVGHAIQSVVGIARRVHRIRRRAIRHQAARGPDRRARKPARGREARHASKRCDDDDRASVRAERRHGESMLAAARAINPQRGSTPTLRRGDYGSALSSRLFKNFTTSARSAASLM